MEAWATLGGPEGADRESTREAWKRQLMEHHPDHHPEDPQAEAKTRRIQQAWEALEEHFDW